MVSWNLVGDIIKLISIGTLDVRVRGNSIVPPSILGRFSILCAILRQLHLILQITWSGELRELRPTAFFVDQLSAGLPLLAWLWPRIRILFYCHFPDLLLAKGRAKWYKRIYRLLFDSWEGWSMSFADSIAVNSGFTKSVVSKQWPDLAAAKQLDIVYPCVDIAEKKWDDGDSGLVWRDTNIILSINRFEEKKNIGLAIKAFARLPKRAREGVRLVVAGGYDPRVQENVVYHQDLMLLAEGLGLRTATTKNIATSLAVPDNIEVLFLLSVPASLKDALLKSARLLVYTPTNEHFGIVPLEAMLVGTPVLAANTGGPLETVVEGVTGWLRDPEDNEKWTEVMDLVLHKLPAARLETISQAGKQRVKAEFSEEKMAARLDGMIDSMAGATRKSTESLGLTVITAVTIAPILAAAVIAYIWFR
jgi:alpha-1,3/alpha-1,6-mannosyltransferase